MPVAAARAHRRRRRLERVERAIGQANLRGTTVAAVVAHGVRRLGKVRSFAPRAQLRRERVVGQRRGAARAHHRQRGVKVAAILAHQNGDHRGRAPRNAALRVNEELAKRFGFAVKLEQRRKLLHNILCWRIVAQPQLQVLKFFGIQIWRSRAIYNVRNAIRVA